MNKLLMIAGASFVALTFTVAASDPAQLRLQTLKTKTTRELTIAQSDMSVQIEALRAEVGQLKTTVSKLEARVAELDSPHPKLIPLTER